MQKNTLTLHKLCHFFGSSSGEKVLTLTFFFFFFQYLKIFPFKTGHLFSLFIFYYGLFLWILELTQSFLKTIYKVYRYRARHRDDHGWMPKIKWSNVIQLATYDSVNFKNYYMMKFFMFDQRLYRSIDSYKVLYHAMLY